MLLFYIYGALVWASGFSSAATKSIQLDHTARNIHPQSYQDTVQAIGRALSAVKRDTVFKNSTTINKSWNGAVLFSYTAEESQKSSSLTEAITITCTACYITGNASAQLTIEGNFNATQAFDSILNVTETTFDTIESSAVDYVENALDELFKADDFDFDDFQPPTMSNVTFDLQIQEIPQAVLQLQFDGLEFYVQLDTTLDVEATHTINLFTPQTPLAITVPGLDVGVWFTVDLILSADAEIDMSSGFHVKLDDGVKIDIAMFAKNASGIILPGGRFELLPVTIESAGVTVTATLRLFAKAGIQVMLPKTPDSLTLFNQSVIPSVGGGIVAQVFADISQVVANISTPSQGDGCDFDMVALYGFNIGAGVGATFTLDSHTWGPDMSTSTAIYYTTMPSLCATKANSTTSSATATSTTTGGFLAKRDLTTTTLSTTQIFSGVGCESPGLVNCPGSLQTTLKSTSTITLVTAVPSGSTAAFPTLTLNSVASTVAFGPSAHILAVIEGSPRSYMPPASPTPGGATPHNIISGSTGGVPNRVIIGVSVGLGVPVVAAIACCCWYFLKRRKERISGSAAKRPDTLGNPATPGNIDYFVKAGKTSTVKVRQVGN